MSLLDNQVEILYMNTQMNRSHHDYLQERARNIIEGVGLRLEASKLPYKFADVGNGPASHLVQFFNVPGNACFLDLSFNDVNDLRDREKSRIDYIEWSPHNVDDIHQAYALASICIRWAQTLNKVLD